MSGRLLITTGAIGAALAALCCATPILAVVLGGIGLTAWLTNPDSVVMAALALRRRFGGLGLYRRQAAATCCDTTGKERDSTS